MGSLFWTLAMLILLFYSFGVVLTSLVVEHCRYPVAGVVPECPELLYRYWSSVPESMLTLFMAISGGVNWDDAIRPLRDVSLMALVLMVVYVFITVFAVLNAARRELRGPERGRKIRQTVFIKAHNKGLKARSCAV